MTPAERLRKNQRLLDKAIRELDQQRVKLEKQEKTLVSQIRQSAQKGQMGACKIQAKDLVRTRRYIEKFYSMRSQLQKISLRLQVRGYIPPGIPKTGPTDDYRILDLPHERADDASYEGRDNGSWKHEPNNEPTFFATDSHGVRARERYHGTATRDDG